MRRRTPINVWPSLADLMTVLAVPALCTAVGLYPYYRNDDDPSLDRSPDKTQREAAMNEEMFQAIQGAERVVKRISASLPQQLGARPKRDQAIDFGDDLADYVINGYVPTWRSNSRKRLEDYCRIVSKELGEEYPEDGGKRFVTILVEGHTDDTQCKKRPGCNWYISAARAGAFLTLMKKDNFCPGGAEFDLRPVGYADTRPLAGKLPTRRIALRLVPNYERIIEDIEKRRGKS